jgi:hypothetical protein
MRRVVPCVLLALSLADLASRARADETLATLAAPTPVDARAGRLLWSERVPGTERFLRVTLPGGRTREAISRRGLLAAALDAGRFLYVQSSFPPDEGCGDATCMLARSDPVAFR